MSREPALVSLRELSRRTGLSEPTLRRLRDEGGMPVYQLGKRRQAVILDEFWVWFRKHRVNDPSIASLRIISDDAPRIALDPIGHERTRSCDPPRNRPAERV